MREEKLILVTNDDGIHAKGLKSLIEVVKNFGKIVVVAPNEQQSGMSHAITVKHPIRLEKVKEYDQVTLYRVNGTPVDCIKLALNKILPKDPDLIVSGINHGANTSTSIIYSGTLAAALEGAINNIPAIGFSLLSFDHDADFEPSKEYIKTIIGKVFENNIPRNTCLNVNIPDVPSEKIAGIKICRQNLGYWKEEFDKRTDPNGKVYYWLTGEFHNTEPEAKDTDLWALKHNYISIVPQHVDLTSYKTMDIIKKWGL